MIVFNPHNDPLVWICTYFTEEDTEAQRKMYWILDQFLSGRASIQAAAGSPIGQAASGRMAGNQGSSFSPSSLSIESVSTFDQLNESN